MSPPGSKTGSGQTVTLGKSTVRCIYAFGYRFQWTTDSTKHIPVDWPVRDSSRDDHDSSSMIKVNARNALPGFGE